MGSARTIMSVGLFTGFATTIPSSDIVAYRLYSSGIDPLAVNSFPSGTAHIESFADSPLTIEHSVVGLISVLIG